MKVTSYSQSIECGDYAVTIEEDANMNTRSIKWDLVFAGKDSGGKAINKCRDMPNYIQCSHTTLKEARRSAKQALTWLINEDINSLNEHVRLVRQYEFPDVEEPTLD